MSRDIVALLVATCAAAACGPSRTDLASERALAFLESHDGEYGADVVAGVQIHAAMTGDAQAATTASMLRAGLGTSELERYGRLLELDKPPFAPGRQLDELPDAAPSPDDVLMDERVQRCVDEVLACEITDACREFATLSGRGGYVLTHQAIWLLVARWTRCETGVALEARRGELAAALLAEAAYDPEPSDLFLERLATIAHLGYADHLEPAWIDAMLDAQRSNGCFPLDAAGACHSHPTSVALWVLAHLR